MNKNTITHQTHCGTIEGTSFKGFSQLVVLNTQTSGGQGASGGSVKLGCTLSKIGRAASVLFSLV